MPLLRDFVLASLHDLAAFAYVALLAVELVLVQPNIDAAAIKRLPRIDLGFAAAAVTVALAGFAGLRYGVKGAAYYIGNPVFWGKLAIFALISFLSIGPSRRFRAWRRLVNVNGEARPPPTELAEIRRIIRLEIALVCLLPVLSVAMALGYGLP